MAGAVDMSALKEPLVILTAAAVVVPLFHRFKISPVLGFILCGILLGPSGLGALAEVAPWLAAVTIQDRESIGLMAELGIVFLMFAIGLELSFERLMLMRRVVFGLGGVQMTVSAAIITLVCWQALGLSGTAAAVMGLALSLSSTAVVLQSLSDQRRLGTATGRGSFGVLLFQDLAVVPILFAVSMMAPQRMGLGVGGLVQSLLVSGVAVALTIVVGRLLLRPLFRQAARTRSPEIFMAASLLVVIATGSATAAAGLSMALGAFLAGLLLAETEFAARSKPRSSRSRACCWGCFSCPSA
jgi:CPA2 family monovalent cation:H+ antiporter-2